MQAVEAFPAAFSNNYHISQKNLHSRNIDDLIAFDNSMESEGKEINYLIWRMRCMSFLIDDSEVESDLYQALKGLSKLSVKLENTERQEKALISLLEALEVLRGNLERGVHLAASLLEFVDILMQYWSDSNTIQCDLDAQIKLITAIGELTDLYLRYTSYQDQHLVSPLDGQTKTKFANLIKKFEALYPASLLEERPDLEIAIDYAKTSINILRSSLHIDIAKKLNELYLKPQRMRTPEYESISQELTSYFNKFGKGAIADWFSEGFFFKGVGANNLHRDYDHRIFDTPCWQASAFSIDFLARIILSTKCANFMTQAFEALKRIIYIHQTSPRKNYLKKLFIGNLFLILKSLADCKEHPKPKNLPTPEGAIRYEARKLITESREIYSTSRFNNFLQSQFDKIGLSKSQKKITDLQTGKTKLALWYAGEGEFAPKKVINPLNIRPANNPFEIQAYPLPSAFAELIHIHDKVPLNASSIFSSEISASLINSLSDLSLFEEKNNLYKTPITQKTLIVQ